jgi:hypothetical protein
MTTDSNLQLSSGHRLEFGDGLKIHSEFNEAPFKLWLSRPLVRAAFLRLDDSGA